MMTNINKIISNKLSILFAILFISYIIYIRFLLIRLPKNLYLIDAEHHIRWNVLFLIITGIIVSCFMLKNVLLPTKKQNIFQQFFNKIITFMENSLKELHILIFTYIPNNYTIMSKLATNFYTFFNKIPETFFVFILLAIRLIILCAFLIDVYINFELYYMYKALYLLCFSLIINLWFYLLKDFSQNLEEIQAMLIIEQKGIDPETQLPITHYTLKEDFKHLELTYLVQEYINCLKISGYLDYYQRYTTFFTPYFNIFIYLLYLITWLYILFYNLSLLF